MSLMIGGVAWLLALGCAALMGLAIQRGATCTVAAVDQLVAGRRPTRLAAMVEASLWVAGGLLLARELGWQQAPPAGYAAGGWTIAGAALLGLGAWVNGACVFGAVARLGSGQWAYVATPLGFFIGCLSVGSVFQPMVPHVLAAGSPVWAAPPLLAWLAVALVASRMFMVLRWRRGEPWTPHAATAVIGLTFLALLLLAGAWTYTDVLADLGRAMAHDVRARLMLALALFAGALAGGRGARLWRPYWPPAGETLRCLAGGLLMGWGSLLIPGGNDNLVLLGMPLLWPYAWTAFATMCAVIGGAIWLSARLSPAAVEPKALP